MMRFAISVGSSGSRAPIIGMTATILRASNDPAGQRESAHTLGRDFRVVDTYIRASMLLLFRIKWRLSGYDTHVVVC